MSDIEDETEIKIEYFESFEVDPLCENNQRTEAELKLHVVSSNINSKGIIDKEGVIERHNTKNDVIKSSDKNNVPIEPENDIQWYKLVDSNKKYVCRFCDLSYSTTQTLRNHIKGKHTDYYLELKNVTINNLRKKKLKCHVCKKLFKNTHNLENHVKIHGFNNIQKSCSVCHATFQETAEMITHMTSKHNTVMRNTHLCSLCGYSTSKLSHFKQHEKTHTQENKKKCSYCDYSTNYTPNLKIHERIHTNDKPYICDYKGCEYRCAAKSSLYSHRLQHDKDKYKLYCDKCSYSTVYKQSLRKHIDSHNRNTLKKKF